MSDIKKLTWEVDFERVFSLYYKIIRLVAIKCKHPTELYLASRMITVDLERDFGIVSSDNVEKFLGEWKKQEWVKEALRKAL